MECKFMQSYQLEFDDVHFDVLDIFSELNGGSQGSSTEEVQTVAVGWNNCEGGFNPERWIQNLGSNFNPSWGCMVNKHEITEKVAANQLQFTRTATHFSDVQNSSQCKQQIKDFLNNWDNLYIIQAPLKKMQYMNTTQVSHTIKDCKHTARVIIR